ncbi:major histocompatibility complex class I-related gene protein-like [Thamnophis elegans]|uniref:major histocompatibility complex class I-related gene protein-like n=1 Tax=Thamnophis elegans TaxID=35005 RepID=UPI001377BEA8|nr:major histocompatibility complex class I-related gene protein-like [Thamnophis elegans]
MSLHRAPLLLWGAVLGSFVLGTFCDSPPHSLSYSYLQLSEPTQGQNQFLIRGYLDDQPIIRFDSLTRKMEPLVPWMEKAEKETFLGPEWVFRADLEKLSKLDHHAGGLHIWQVNLGCELREDGTKGGFLHYGYNGKDLISFDKEIPIWVITQSKAMKVKEEWEKDTGWSERNKIYLEETCIEWLQRYLSYRRKTLQRTEPPVGKVTRKVVDDSLEVLICQAFGFYPKEIQATWTRDGENWEHETLQRNVAPNSDGTYYVLLSIEIDPKERNHFWCHLEHEGLQEPLVLAWKEEADRTWWIPVGIVAAIILGAGIFFLKYQWRRSRKDFHCKMILCHDPNSQEKKPSMPMDVTEDEMQSQRLLQPKVSSELLKCSLNGGNIEHQFLYMPECPVPLLGRDILCKLGATLSFEEDKVALVMRHTPPPDEIL